MRDLYRVVPWNPDAAADQPGGVLFRPPGGLSRIDNPDLYRTLYAAGTPEAAIAETLGRLNRWVARSLRRRDIPLALGVMQAPDDLPIVNLADRDTLSTLGVTTVTDVITRDRAITQMIARRVFERGGSAGVSWWSYYDPAWTIYGLWDIAQLNVTSVEPLTLEHPAVAAAAAALPRYIDHRGPKGHA